MSSAMDSLMSTVDTITSADSDEASCTACTTPVDTPVGFVAKSPPPSPKDGKLASSGVSTMSAALALPPAAPHHPGSSSPPGTASSLLTASSKLHSSPTNTASSLKTRSLDGLLGPGGACPQPSPQVGAGHHHHRGLDATSTTTTVSDVSSGRAGSTSDENAFLFLGCVQALLGVLMVVFGVLAMLHRASMSSVGAGVWGGAISFVSGVAGVIAGLRSCYSSSGRGGSGRPPIAPTVFMALSLVALAVANLVLVLAAIGLVRDARTPDIQLLREEEDAEEEDAGASPGSSHWERVLASCGLLLASGLQLLAAIASGYRCYRLVCPCAARTARKHSPLYNQRSSGGSPDSLHSMSGLYSSGSKERLVSRWLTRQVPNGPVYTGSPTPSGLLLFSTQPPPP
ncbi:Envoplakin, partial [Frankliniella fusca]